MAVGDGVRFAFRRVLKELVDQNRPFRRHIFRFFNIFHKHVFVADDFHAAAAQHEGRTDHQRISDLMRDGAGLLQVARHAGTRHRDAKLLHHLAEQVAVFRHVDRRRRRAENVHAVLLQLVRQIQWRLPAELDDDAHRLLLLIDAQHVFQRKRFKIKLIRCVIIRRDRLRIAVDHDRLIAHVAQRQGGVDAAIVEFDALPDAVRAAAENHDFLLVVRSLDLVFAVVR